MSEICEEINSLKESDDKERADLTLHLARLRYLKGLNQVGFFADIRWYPEHYPTSYYLDGLSNLAECLCLANYLQFKEMVITIKFLKKLLKPLIPYKETEEGDDTRKMFAAYVGYLWGDEAAVLTQIFEEHPDFHRDIQRFLEMDFHATKTPIAASTLCKRDSEESWELTGGGKRRGWY
ncbi:uncharacterized protein FPOAC1_013921 [Fusarium poae]|uniref:uncharacterized protein n=1 Tax=Fusarium poae TaxID=36050 RepID=UPI001D036A13|nr:uncharacterized protein FPOAC1_013921 [Fusarium poae]KAG8664214.1 hypothetical protein FPOAC1_013921 [Fusarium poae]